MKRSFVLILIALAGLVAVAAAAEATHLRGGTLNWKQLTPGATETEVHFNGTVHWSYSSQGSPALGATCNSGSIQIPGYPGTTYAQIAVAFDADPNENWVVCKIVDPTTLQDGVSTFLPNGAGPLLASTSFSARISASSGHVNNPDQRQLLETTVDLRTPNNSPVVFMPPMYSCDPNMVCHIPIFAGDFENDPLNYRMATSAEAGAATFDQPGPPDAPNLISVNMNTTPPELVWDTTGAAMSTCAGCPTLYSTSIMVEDLDANGTVMTKAASDFFIRIEPQDPPYWQVPPSVSDDGIHCGGTVVGKQLRSMGFTMRAAHNNTAKSVNMFLSPITPVNGLPGSASLVIGTPANPVSASFTWTPPAGTAGNTYNLIFYAHSGPHYAHPCEVKLKIKPLIPPVADFSCYTPKVPYLEVQFTDLSSDLDGNITSMTWSWGDGQSTTGAPTGQVWKHNYPAKNHYNVTLTVTDDDGLTASKTVMCFANNNRPPVLDDPGHHYIGEGQTLTFTVTGFDPDLDPVTFGWEPAALPASAAFDPKTQKFTWTPVEGMAGQWGPVPFAIRDFEFVDFGDAYITVNPAPSPGEESEYDVDGDNVPDDRDNCPTMPNTDQLDTDGDGIGDVCDSAPGTPAEKPDAEEPEPESPVEAGAEEDLDSDGDGIADSKDNCVFTVNPDQRDMDGDTTGDLCDPDIDGDRVNQLDAEGRILDNCPFTPNALQLDADGDGVGDACVGDQDADGIPDAQDDCPSGLCDHADFVAAERTAEDAASEDAAESVMDTPLPLAVGIVALVGAALRRRP